MFLTVAHYNIGVKANANKDFYISSIGSAILVFDCLILSSYPFVALNVLWLIISIIGYKKIELKGMSFCSDKVKHVLSTIILVCLLAFGIRQLYLGNNDQAAWMTTSIYLLSYLLFSTKTITRESYLIWCIPAFLLSIPHLLNVSNFAIITNEFIGALISIYSVIIFMKNRRISL